MLTPRELKNLYLKGENVTEILKNQGKLTANDEQIIEISYDLQTGSYIEAMRNKKYSSHKKEYTKEIAKIILSLCKPESILEAGVGEATTLSGTVKNLSINNIETYGFDLSWSRVALGKKWLDRHQIKNYKLCSGSLLNIPFASDSIDIVYTSHSIEPNGGNEKPILKELYRVTRKYLILLEPGYELADEKGRRRMEKHGYCKNLKEFSESLGYEIIEHKLFPFIANPLNPTAITIIRKNTKTEKPDYTLACPIFKTKLKDLGGMLFSPEALVVYPVLGDIPCLRIENGILASLYDGIIRDTK